MTILKLEIGDLVKGPEEGIISIRYFTQGFAKKYKKTKTVTVRIVLQPSLSYAVRRTFSSIECTKCISLKSFYTDS